MPDSIGVAASAQRVAQALQPDTWLIALRGNVSRKYTTNWQAFKPCPLALKQCVVSAHRHSQCVFLFLRLTSSRFRASGAFSISFSNLDDTF